MLDLTKAEGGRNLTKDEFSAYSATVREEVNVFGGDAKRKGIEFLLVENPIVTLIVVGYQRHIRQATLNANAIQNTSLSATKLKAYFA